MAVVTEKLSAGLLCEPLTAMGGIDGVVNAAGMVARETLENTPLDTWERVIKVNLTGSFLVCRAAIPFLRRATGSTIVNRSSATALFPGTAGTSYTVAKAGVLAMSKALALELAPAIRVNVVCPGTTDTPMAAGTVVKLKDPATANEILSRFPLRRVGQSGEIASVLLFLTSNESSFMTGTAIAVDGGRTLH